MNDTIIINSASTPATTPTASAGKQRRLIIATSLGNGLEIFDFTIYSFFALLIGKLFFPAEGEYTSLMMSLATFGVGFITRPIGAILIGNYADRHGRKAALTLTIILMTLGTALIGLAPTYAQIGIAAPLIILAGRMVQGFSAGGEVGAATTLLMESGSNHGRGYRVSFQLASQGIAALIGALFATLLSTKLSPASLESWGWRVPFLLGLSIGPVGLFIRRHLEETHTQEECQHSAFRDLILGHWKRVLLGIGMMIGGTSTMYIMVFYMPSYMIKTLGLSAQTSFLSSCLSGAIMFVFAPLGGILADRMRLRKPLLMFLSILLLVIIYPAFLLFQEHPSLPVILVVVGVVVMLKSLIAPAGTLLLLEGFPRAIRVSGLAVVYSLGVTFFGGFAQLTVTWLISVTGNPMAPAWYLTSCLVISIIALQAFREQPQD